MAFNITAAQAILKDFYLAPLREEINLSTALMAQLERKTVQLVGKRGIIPLHVQRSEAVGARADGGTLPTANTQGYTDAIVPFAYQYGSISITGPTIEQTKSDQGAFIRAVDSETKFMTSEFKEDINRQLARNDSLGTGALATLATNASGTTLNLTGADSGTALFLRAGQTVDFATGSTVNTTADSITAVTQTAGIATSITVGTAAATTSGDIITRTGANGKESIGLPGIVSDAGVLLGVDPATYPVWKSTNVNNGGTAMPLSETLMQNVMSQVSIASGETPDAIVTQHSQRDHFYAVLSSLKRAVNTLELKGGYKSLAFNDDVPLLVDRFIHPQKMFFVNLDHLAIYEVAPVNWADRDGAILSRIPGQDVWAAFVYYFMQFGTDRRNSHGVLQDLAA